MLGKQKSIDFTTEKTTFKHLKLSLEEELKKLDNTSDEEVGSKDLQDRLYKMIDYSIKRHDWYEDQKQKLLQIGIGLLGVFAAFTGIIAKLAFDKSIEGWPFIFCILFLVCGLGSGLIILFKYNHTISLDHPYRKVVDIRSWFFKYNFNNNLKDKISKDEKKAKQEVNDIISGFENFTRNWMDFAKEKRRFLVEDIEQVFILQILQKYRSQQLKSISKTLTYGVISSVAFLILSFFTYTTSNKASSEGQEQQIKNAVDSTRRVIMDSISKISVPQANQVVSKSGLDSLKIFSNPAQSKGHSSTMNKKDGDSTKIDTTKKLNTGKGKTEGKH